MADHSGIEREQGALFTMEPALYQMQSWDAADPCTCRTKSGGIRTDGGHDKKCKYPGTTHSWVPMENGVAPVRWRPVHEPREAVEHAAAWSGAVNGFGIPAMQVVELGTGRVIWRSSEQYEDAGEPIAPPWQEEVYAKVRAEWAQRAAREASDSQLNLHENACS